MKKNEFYNNLETHLKLLISLNSKTDIQLKLLKFKAFKAFHFQESYGVWVPYLL